MTTDSSASVRAAVLVEPDRFEIREFPVPSVTDDAALIDVELCGVCGTDLKYASGRLPAPYPIILGHEVVGRVAAIGRAAAAHHGLAVGDRVLVESSIPCWHCDACRSGAYRLCPTKGGYGTRTSSTVAPGLWGGMAEQMFIAPGSILHRLPAGMPAETAVGVPLLANGLQWLLHQGGLGPGDRVLIQGCGPQGLAAVLVARSVGAREVVVTGLETDAGRLAFATRSGARTVVVHEDDSPEARIERVGSAFDVALDVSGSPAAIAGAPAHLRPRGTFVLAGLVGRGTTVPIATDELVWREIRIQAVLSKDEAAIRSALALVIGQPEIGVLLGKLITDVFPLDDVASAIGAVKAGLDGFVKAAVQPDYRGSARRRVALA
jgi:alcohol dehydrogenase